MFENSIESLRRWFVGACLFEQSFVVQCYEGLPELKPLLKFIIMTIDGVGQGGTRCHREGIPEFCFNLNC